MHGAPEKWYVKEIHWTFQNTIMADQVRSITKAFNKNIPGAFACAKAGECHCIINFGCI